MLDLSPLYNRFDHILKFGLWYVLFRLLLVILFQTQMVAFVVQKAGRASVLCEVAHLAETATRPNTKEASSSSADSYGFHDNESDKVEVL